MGRENFEKIQEWVSACPHCKEKLVIQELPTAMTCPFCNSMFALKENDKGEIVSDPEGLEAAKIELEKQEELEVIERLKDHISLLLADGESKEKIKKVLIKEGCDIDTAQQLVDRVDNEFQAFKETQEGRELTSERYKGHMIFGVILLIAGILLSLFTYSSAASGRGGGIYIVWTGAIVGGFIEFFRGLFRWQKNKRKVQ